MQGLAAVQSFDLINFGLNFRINLFRTLVNAITMGISCSIGLGWEEGVVVARFIDMSEFWITRGER
jgi:hypothetical protein